MSDSTTMTDQELFEDCVEKGLFERKLDGSYVLSELGRHLAEEAINKHPELFAKLFPDRLQ